MSWIDEIHVGDCRALMRQMISDRVKVNCIVTSPPYFGLRDYGHDEQIGLEASPADYVEQMIAVFASANELLADDGTLWLNLGDSYAGAGRGPDTGSTLQGSRDNQQRTREARTRMIQSRRRDDAPVQRSDIRLEGFKPKDLMGMPWRVAFGLQDAGWYLRQDIIWAKPNPMPESVSDRCTKAHEYVFLLSKSKRYYFDAKSIAEPVTDSTRARLAQPGLAQQVGSDRVPGKTNGNMKAVGDDDLRNARSVWSIPTTPFTGSHFATFPRDLVRRCIMAGCPAGGVVLDPFMGSGTVAEVALSLGRRFIGCELNPEYAALFASHRSSQRGLAV